MPCNRISKKPSLICVGEMDKYVTLIKRKIDPDDVSYTMDLSDTVDMWARVDTKAGIETFDGVNTNRGPSTDTIYIYNIVDIEEGYLFKIGDRYTRIINIENINREDIFLRVTCVETGTTTKQSAWA